LTKKPFNSIGVGVTFSPNLKANICEASRLALIFDSRLVLIHVGEQTKDKENTFKTFLKKFLDQGLDYSIVFKPGDPVHSILTVAEVENIDLLILGALKRESFFRYYLGSIARKITRFAGCSVLLLINPSVEHVPCRHVVVNGLEDPKTSETISTAFYIGHKLKSNKITIVEEIKQSELAVKVDDDASLVKSAEEREQLRLREESRINQIVSAIPDIQKEGLSIHSQPIFGKRGYSIGHYAQVVRADLLVMNAPNKLGFWDRLFPHDIEHILTELPTDVLIIR
jgi:nucleotide-binding universal stress UspA family protein